MQCRDAALAVAKVLYGKLFDWIVLRIDGVLRPRDQFSATSSQVIGILDVFGFEKFAVNGCVCSLLHLGTVVNLTATFARHLRTLAAGSPRFDQMCINLANEQLHYFFNEKIFSDELQAYKEEGLGVLDVYFTDNKHVFDMFLRKPLGFLALMDEEASFTHSTDRSMLMKLNKYLKEDSVYLVSKGSSQFGVKHYAGDVIYTVDGFLEKNKDPLPEMVRTHAESH